jgi:predicted neuraminidase
MAHVFVSVDQGHSWQRRGGVKFPDASYDEHQIVERKDGSLWMTARTNNGIWESFSFDKGWNWSAPQKYMEHVSSRHFIRRLRSGRLLLVRHGGIDERTGTRSKLMAFVSDDEGRTWKGGLMLDERRGVSYPDGFQDRNGMIYISYDRNRATDGCILMACFTEEDVLQKKLVGPSSRLKQVICQPGALDKAPAPSDIIFKKSTP